MRIQVHETAVQEASEAVIGREASQKPEQGWFLQFCKRYPVGMKYFCMAGIIFFYSKFALLQETLLDERLALNLNFVILIQNAVAVAVSIAILIGTGSADEMGRALTPQNLLVACLNYGAYTLTYMAMQNVPYTFVLLCTSAKTIPVLFVGAFRGVYKPSLAQFGLAVCLSGGLIIFNLGKLKSERCELRGMVYLVLSLLFEGLQSTQIDIQRKRNQRTSAYTTMLVNNVVALTINFLLFQRAVRAYDDQTHLVVARNPELLGNCLFIAVCMSLGQVFIFLTISLYDCYLVTVLTTTRKFFSIVLSNIQFGHRFTPTQWGGASIVVACTVLELASKK